MGHTKATPESERPTIEELRRHTHKPVWIAMKVTGYWETLPDGTRPEFKGWHHNPASEGLTFFRRTDTIQSEL